MLMVVGVNAGISNDAFWNTHTFNNAQFELSIVNGKIGGSNTASD